jgi:hypothetical protein
MDENDEISFQMSQSDSGELDRTTTSRICSKCNKDFQNTPGARDFLTDGLCDDCAEILKAGIKRMEKETSDELLSNDVPNSRGTSSNGIDVEDNNLYSTDDNNGGHGPHAEDLDNTPNSSLDTSEVSKSGDQVIQEVSPISDDSNIKIATTQEDEMTFDVMLSAVFSCGAKTGRVTIHGNEYEFSACAKSISGRGGATTLIVTEYSKSIPDLFGYYYYAGVYTRSFSCLAFTMTECGNLFMGVMETMCNKCRVDAVIYFAETKICRIITDRNWRRQFKLNCILHLTVDIAEAKR